MSSRNTVSNISFERTRASWRLEPSPSANRARVRGCRFRIIPARCSPSHPCEMSKKSYLQQSSYWLLNWIGYSEQEKWRGRSIRNIPSQASSQDLGFWRRHYPLFLELAGNQAEECVIRITRWLAFQWEPIKRPKTGSPV